MPASRGVRFGDVVDDPPYAVAMTCARLGWRVLPLRGKRPITRGWQEDATTDPNVIEEWWMQRYINASVGIAMGPVSGIWVLDIDVKNGVDGVDSLAALARGRELPETFTVRTLSGRGLHMYWQWPELGEGEVITNSNGRLGPCLDVKGARGQVRAPHKEADILDRRWPVPAPDWLITEVTKASKSRGEGDVTRPAYWVDSRAAVVDAAARLAIAAEGGRNDALNYWAWKLSSLSRDVDISRDDAYDALMFACRENGLWAEEPEQCTVTFTSGWTAGMSREDRS